MKPKSIIILSIAAIILVVVAVLENNQKSTQEVLSEQFSEYVKDQGLITLRVAFPQWNEHPIIAVYETFDRKFGIIEFGVQEKAKFEKDIEGDYTIVSLEGNDGHYVGILVNEEFRERIAAVVYYDEGHQNLLESRFLEDEFIVMDRLQNDLSDVHTIEFVDQDGEVVAVAEKPF